MKRRNEIDIHLDSTNQLSTLLVPSPFLNRWLQEDAEKYIVKIATGLPEKNDVKIIFHLPETEISKGSYISSAFRQHFAARREEVERELRRVRQFGWRSFLIALLFLGLVILCVELLQEYVGKGNVSAIIREGLVILGWIALWRPGELLLYEWYPYKRDIKLFSRLENAEIHIVGPTERE
jgi:hypothetical protein